MGESQVVNLYTKTETGEEEAIVSIDVATTFAIGESRSLTLRTMLDRKLPLVEQKRAVREMMEIADHEKAHYELIDLEMELAARERALKHAEENVAQVAGRHAKRRAEITAEIDLLKRGGLEAAEKHEREFRASGRQGKFKPSQHQQNEMVNIDRDITKLEAELKGIDDTEGSERNGCLQALAQGRLDVRVCKEKIEKCRRILGLPLDDGKPQGA